MAAAFAYRPLAVPRDAAVTTGPTARSAAAEAAFWDGFSNPVLVREYASITSIHFSPTRPHDFAVTSSTRVQLYGSSAQAVKATFSRFGDLAFSGHLRDDARLLVAGDATGAVKVFDAKSRSVLRTFAGHKDAVRVTRFSSVHSQILSASDDKTAIVWDMLTQKPLVTFDCHKDHVRAGAVNNENPHIVMTGSYDHCVRLFDIRVPRSSSCIMTFDHADPVESVLFLPGSSLVASTGSSRLCIWNMFSSGSRSAPSSNAFQTASDHQKSITCSALDGTGTRILTGSLDAQVKVYGVEEGRVLHSLKYPAPILALGVSPDNLHLAVGMTTGLLSVRTRVVKTEDLDDDPAAVDWRGRSYAAVRPLRVASGPRGRRAATGAGRSRTVRPRPGDLLVDEEGDVASAVHLPGGGPLVRGGPTAGATASRAAAMVFYDRLLASFQYARALDAAVERRANRAIAIEVLKEIVQRDALTAALGGRDDVGLEPIARFLAENIIVPKYSQLLVHVANVILDMYTPVIGQSSIIDELFDRIRKEIRRELNLQSDITRCLGLLEMLI
ncbi:snoRNA-binding rRNA-processing protein, partial [Cladochytrium tenue]